MGKTHESYVITVVKAHHRMDMQASKLAWISNREMLVTSCSHGPLQNSGEKPTLSALEKALNIMQI